MQDYFKYYNHLGFHNPYYLRRNDNLIIQPSFERIIEEMPAKERFLDYTAIAEVFSTGYCLGDRTLVRGIKKSPWMAKPNELTKEWEHSDVPHHLERIETVQDAATNFLALLKNELVSYVMDCDNIGLLLTGGMDSRIVAAVLKNLLDDGTLTGKTIYTYTWGSEDSRDVIYARKIAELYGWQWKHLVVDVNQMMENYGIAVMKGCEYTAIHLHAMPQVGREGHLNCVLAGSFGDSVGRAEFSGVKVTNLKRIDEGIKNVGGILRHDFLKLVKEDVENDILQYHTRFPKKLMFQRYEQDQQLHYMRRMLNACMSTIDTEVPLYQMFTSPDVFGYIWSLDPTVRTDEIYRLVLADIAPELLTIPWARTGLPYPEVDGKPDFYRKKHHDYGKMIRDNFLTGVEKKIVDNIEIASMLFDVRSLRNLIRNLNNFPIKGSLAFEEKVLYVGQVISFINDYNINIETLPAYNGSWKQALKEDLYYKGRFIYKTIIR